MSRVAPEFAMRQILAAALLSLLGSVAFSEEKGGPEKLPLLLAEDFTKGAGRWQPTDPAAWKVIDIKGGKAYSQFRQSKYKPPHRSPLNYALLKDLLVGDFVLEARAQSTARDYGHRDLCLFFGYQG